MIGETMAIALILIYSFVIVAHLYFCYFGNEPLRKITKLLLMPLLLTVYCIATESIALGIVIALCAGFLGDLFLLKVDETNYFMIGLSCFLIGHIFYISSILKNAQWNIVQYAIILVVMLIALLFMYRYLIRRMPKNLQVSGLVYMFALLCLFGSSFIVFWQNPSTTYTMLVIGALMFCLSDFLLAKSTFLGKIKNENFYIMITYIAAQTLIVVSFM